MGTVARVVKKLVPEEVVGAGTACWVVPAKVGLGELQNMCNVVDFELRDFLDCQHMKFAFINVRIMVVLFWEIGKHWVVIESSWQKLGGVERTGIGWLGCLPFVS